VTQRFTRDRIIEVRALSPDATINAAIKEHVSLAEIERGTSEHPITGNIRRRPGEAPLRPTRRRRLHPATFSKTATRSKGAEHPPSS